MKSSHEAENLVEAINDDYDNVEGTAASDNACAVDVRCG